MKVRLKPALNKAYHLIRIWFQFHEGPIKTSPKALTHTGNILCFNSMKVRLKLCIIGNTWNVNTSFNSMKVRLKQANGIAHIHGLLSFNSMKVRLKQPPSMLSPLDSARFQFHEGPIKTESALFTLAACTVSIP